jgi:hypothetical protein
MLSYVNTIPPNSRPLVPLSPITNATTCNYVTPLRHPAATSDNLIRNAAAPLRHPASQLWHAAAPKRNIIQQIWHVPPQPWDNYRTIFLNWNVTRVQVPLKFLSRPILGFKYVFRQ